MTSVTKTQRIAYRPAGTVGAYTSIVAGVTQPSLEYMKEIRTDDVSGHAVQSGAFYAGKKATLTFETPFYPVVAPRASGGTDPIVSPYSALFNACGLVESGYTVGGLDALDNRRFTLSLLNGIDDPASADIIWGVSSEYGLGIKDARGTVNILFNPGRELRLSFDVQGNPTDIDGTISEVMAGLATPETTLTSLPPSAYNGSFSLSEYGSNSNLIADPRAVSLTCELGAQTNHEQDISAPTGYAPPETQAFEPTMTLELYSKKVGNQSLGDYMVTRDGLYTFSAQFGTTTTGYILLTATVQAVSSTPTDKGGVQGESIELRPIGSGFNGQQYNPFSIIIGQPSP